MELIEDSSGKSHQSHPMKVLIKDAQLHSVTSYYQYVHHCCGDDDDGGGDEDDDDGGDDDDRCD